MYVPLFAPEIGILAPPSSNALKDEPPILVNATYPFAKSKLELSDLLSIFQLSLIRNLYSPFFRMMPVALNTAPSASVAEATSMSISLLNPLLTQALSNTPPPITPQSVIGTRRPSSVSESKVTKYIPAVATEKEAVPPADKSTTV